MSSAKQYNLQPYQIYPTTAVTSGNKTSAVTEIFNKDNIAIQLLWTGTLAGTFDVQVSADYNHVTGSGTWDSLPLTPVPTASGSADSWLIELIQMAPKYIRTVFTYTSGSGNLTMTLTAKAI